MTSMRNERFTLTKPITIATLMAIATMLASASIVPAADPAPAARDYSRYCESCHGAKGRGDGPRAHGDRQPRDVGM